MSRRALVRWSTMDRSSSAEALLTWSWEYSTAAAASVRATVLVSFEVGGGEVSWGVGGDGVRTAMDCVLGSCDDGGGVIEVERDFSPGVAGRVSSVVGSSEGSMTSSATAVCGKAGAVVFVQRCGRRTRWERAADAAVAFAARAAGKCRESDATVMRPAWSQASVAVRRKRRGAGGEGDVERAGRRDWGVCMLLLRTVCCRRSSNRRRSDAGRPVHPLSKPSAWKLCETGRGQSLRDMLPLPTAAADRA